MIVRNSLKINKSSWTSIPSGCEVKGYDAPRHAEGKILIYRRIVLTSGNGETIKKYGYGLRCDDCTHTKRFIYNALKHYFYVKEILYEI